MKAIFSKTTRLLGSFLLLFGKGVIALIPILIVVYLFGFLWGEKIITLQAALMWIVEIFIPGIVIAPWIAGTALFFIIVVIGAISSPLSKRIYGLIGKAIRHSLKEKIKEQKQGTVILEYFREGLWVIGIVVGYIKGSEELEGGRILKVFVPSVPIPLTGLTPIFVQEEKVIYVDIATDELFNTYFSGGILAPRELPELVKKLKELKRKKIISQ